MEDYYVDKENSQVVLFVPNEVRIDVNDFYKIIEKIDKEMFGKRGIYDDHLAKKVPIMSKEEMHDFMFGLMYPDGSDWTKAISIKLVQFVDEQEEKGEPVFVNDLIEKVEILRDSIGSSYTSFRD